MESIESIREREISIRILKNDSLLIALSLADNQSVAITKANLMKKILIPRIIDLSIPEEPTSS